MAVNKVIYDGNTLIDLTPTTAEAADVAQGKYFVNVSGVLTVGTATGGTPAISVVDTTDTAGGTIRTITALDISDTTAVASDVATGKYFYTADGTKTAGTASGGGGDPWSAYGRNPTLVQTALNEKVYLKDTPFASWTPTDTTTKLSDASDLTSYSASFSDYDYVAVYKCHTHFEYGAGATNVAKLLDYNYIITCIMAGFSANYANMEADTFNSVTYTTVTSRVATLYYNASETLTLTNVHFGYFPFSYPNPTVSLSSITLKKPQMNARCSTPYFSTANAEFVDMNTSYCEMKHELWQVDRGTSAFGKEIATLHDMYEGNF